MSSHRRSVNSFIGPSSPATPQTPVPSRASASRSGRASIVNSPSISVLPSLSASTPFDWDAAKSGQPPPYATPLQQRTRNRQSLLRQNGTPLSARKTAPKRVVRQRPFMEWLTDLPSQTWFKMQMLPETLPLPADKIMGRYLGGLAHCLHFIFRWKALRGLRDEDIGWYDMYEENSSWLGWTTIMSASLIGCSFLSAFYLFTRIRIYRIHHHRTPGEKGSRLVDSPHAKFVKAELNLIPLEAPSPWRYAVILLKRLSLASWRFLMNHDPDEPGDLHTRSMRHEIQELEVWCPREIEKTFFIIYSPAHSVLWFSWAFHNWLSIFFIMTLLSIQSQFVIHSYDLLVKDRSILSAEVMNEYDQKFVIPRVFPVRRDASTQTHQAEMITQHDWEPYDKPTRIQSRWSTNLHG